MTESDRYLAFSDLLFNALDPTAPPVHQALVRLEDVSPGIDTPQQLEADADYLYSQHIPFSVGVIPEYLDPNGTYNNGTPVNENISQTSNATIKAFDRRLAVHAGHGAAPSSSTATPTSTPTWPTPMTGHRRRLRVLPVVVLDDVRRTRGPHFALPEHRLRGPGRTATERLPGLGPNPGPREASPSSPRPVCRRPPSGRRRITRRRRPTTPASTRSSRPATSGERTYGGQLTGGSIDYTHKFGQFFPYVVHDLDGSTVIPEDLGNYEPTMANNNPPRPPAVIVANAQAELAVRQGVASFFFHPYYDVSYLQQIVQGIQALGYTFVSASSLLGPARAPTCR